MPITLQTMQTNKANNGFSMILYGDSGSGKTSLIDSIPAGKVLIISIEGGLGVLQNNHHFQECLMPSLKNPAEFSNKITTIYNFLRFENHNYDYVAIDSSSEMERYFQYSQACLASKTVPTLRHIGTAATIMRKTIMEFRDLKKAAGNFVKRPINPIFIAGSFPLEILRNSEQTVTKQFPMLTKKFSQEICGLVDVVARLEVDAGQHRLLRVNQTTDVMAKTRFKSLKNIVQAPGKRINLFEQVCKPVLAEVKGTLTANTQNVTHGIKQTIKK